MRIVFLAAIVLFLAGCDPFEKEQIDGTERRRVACLDKFCRGDVAPKYNSLSESMLKLNGQWYIGPKSYFNIGTAGAAFYWPSKSPIGMHKDRPGYPEEGSSFSDHAIEIFLSTARDPANSPRSSYEKLKLYEREGSVKVVNKKSNGDSMDVWETTSSAGKETWYIAKKSKLLYGDPPTVTCRGDLSNLGACTGGFLWKPDIWVSLRFSSRHGSDWPEIYQEIEGILTQLKKVQQ